MWWKNPFNRVVRSKEALIIGILTGLIVGGYVASFILPTVVKNDVYIDPIKLCGKAENIEAVTFNFTGNLEKVECKDSRVFDKDDF